MKKQEFAFLHTLEVEVPLPPEEIAALQAQAIEAGQDPSEVPCVETRELKCFIKAAYYPPERGLRDSFGVPLEPDDDALVEILNIKGRAGNEVDFDELERAQQEALIEAAYAQLEEEFYEEY